MAGSEQLEAHRAAPSPRRRRRWLRRTAGVVVAVVLLWALVTVGWAAADTRARDARADQLQALWSADPDRLASARAGETFGAPNIGRWEWGGNTQAATAEMTASGLVVTVVAGSCDPHPWTVVPWWTDDLLVVDARPDVPLLPDFSQIRQFGPHGCDSAAHGERVLVPLDRPLEGRLVVDAWSGVALLPRQSP